jgi:predicted RND superfamily exporter protein
MLTEFVLRWRAPLLIAVLVATALLGVAVMGAKLNADFSTYLSQDSPLVREFNRVGEVFKANYIGMVLVQTDDLFTPENLTLLDRLTRAYKSIEGVDSVTSLTNAVDFQRADGGLIVGKLLEGKPLPTTPEELEKFKRYVLSKEMYVGALVNAKGTTAVILVRLLPKINHFKVAGQIDQVTQGIAPNSDNIYYGGMPFLIYSMTGLILDNMFFLVPLIILLLVGVLEVGFRRLGGVLAPLTVVLLARVWTMGLLSLLGRPIDLLTGIVPVILIAMGSADGIHFMRRFYEARGVGAERREAVRITMREMGTPIVFTSITTMIGFASLAISDFDIIRTFGWATALGIFLALVVTLIVLPAGLSFGRERASVPATTDNNGGPRSVRGGSRAMAALGGWIHRRPGAIALLTVGVIALAAVGIPRIVVNVDWSLCLARGSKPYLAEMLLRREFGGSLPLLVSVKGDVKDPATLETMRAVERHLDALPEVSEAESIASVLAEMNWTLNGRFVVPAARAQVNNLWFLLQGQDVLDQMVRSDNQEALVQAKVASLGTAVISRVVEDTSAFLSRLPQKLIVVDAKQAPPDAQKALTELQSRQVRDALAQDLQAKGLSMETAALEAAVQAGLRWTPGEPDYAALGEAITQYLLSPESEVPFEDPAQAAAVAESITAALGGRGGRLTASELEALLQPQIETPYPEDVAWLAEALVYRVDEFLSARRVEAAYAQLAAQLPPEARSDADLAKKLRGDLWGLTTAVLALSPQQYASLQAQYGLDATRTVTLAAEPSGLAPVLDQMEKELLPTQIESTALALLAVTLLLILVFRSLRAGLLGIIPVGLTILVNFAVLGYFGIGLDSFTAMIASITIGLGIDYAIHFTHRFRKEFERSGDERTALVNTLQTTGVAILINSLSVGAGFAVLLLAGGQHIRLLGGLTAVALLVSALFTLVVLPALTLLWKPRYLQAPAAETLHPEEVQQA